MCETIRYGYQTLIIVQSYFNGLSKHQNLGCNYGVFFFLSLMKFRQTDLCVCLYVNVKQNQARSPRGRMKQRETRVLWFKVGG